MRLSVRVIATAAFAIFLMPAFKLIAGEAAKPMPVDAKNQAAADSDTAVVADPGPSPLIFLTPSASQSTPMPYSRGIDSYTPRIELFLGYSYLRAVPTLATGNRLVWLNGGSTSVAFNLNRYFGLVGDFGGFNDTRLQLTGAAASSTVADSSGTVFTYLGGPRFSYRKHERFTPFAQALFGVVHASDVTLSSGCSGSGCTLLPVENRFAMTAGAGLDLRLRKHLALRIVQGEYLMTRFENLTTGTTTGQNDVRLSTGLVFSFGGNPAPRVPPVPPLAYSCSVNPATAFQGDSLAVSGTALNLDPAKTATYTWSVDGGTVNGSSSNATIATKDLAPGSYTVKGHVSEGDSAALNADCTASYVVKTLEPPTVSCSAEPSNVVSGASSTITATGVSPENWALTYSYSATSGSISGDGATATLSTAGASVGSISVTCKAADDKGQTATATTTVMVSAPVAASKPMTSDLCALHFDRDARRPSRVDNEAKACLDEIALDLQRNPDAQLALIGNASNQEKAKNKLADARAVNAKAYLVSEKGINATRVTVYTGSQDGKTVYATLIPEGATFDSTGDMVQK